MLITMRNTVRESIRNDSLLIGVSFMMFIVALLTVSASVAFADKPLPRWRPGMTSRLMTIGHDGVDPRLVLEAETLIEAPNWSCDGKWLVYNSGGHLFRVASDGSGQPQQINMKGFQGANNDHVLSPDGKTIYFSAHGHIWTVPLVGGVRPSRISNEHAGDDRIVYWLHGVSPDGKTLVHCGVRGDNKDIWTIPTSGGVDTRITIHSGDDDGPDYSSNGRWIYFNSNRSGSNQVWRAPVDGEGEPEQITRDDRVNWFPHPSPDGKWIVYLSYEPGTLRHPANRNVILRRMKPDGSKITNIRHLFGGQGTINVPSWSPDSHRFAFVEYALPSTKASKSGDSE